MSDVNPYIVAGGYSSPQSIYETSTVKNHTLGTKGVLSDGRVFYYAKSSGAAITRGNLCRTAAEDSVGITTSVAAVAAAAGDTSVGMTLGAGSVSAGQFEDGTFIVIDGTNSGQARRIEWHASATNATNLTLYLDAPLEAALTTSEEVSAVRNPFADVVVTPGDSANVQAAGVPVVNIGAGTSTPQYFWIQTYGRAPVVRNNSTLSVNSLVVVASGTTDDAGQVAVVATTTSDLSVTPKAFVGIVASLGDSASDGDFQLIDLLIRA